MSDNHTPAFPSPAVSQNQATGETVVHQSEAGMSLRDYIAVHANLGEFDELSLPIGVRLLGVDCPEYKDDPAGCFAWWADYRSKLRYLEADAMMKAREQ